MIYTARKGQTSSGEAIGILLLDTSVPFIPGDVANATTYPFPVRFHKVEGFTVARAIGKDPSVIKALMEAAEDLAAQGVRAVTGDCGFMAIHQNALAEKIRIPVFLSSLLQIPFIAGLFPGTAKLGIITADAGSLDSRLLKSIGIESPEKLVIAGLENQPRFYDFAIRETGVLDTDKVEKEVIATVRKMTAEHPDIRALLLECSLLPPYAAAVQEAVDLPVFDYITMIRFVFSAVVQKRYSGFI